MGVTSVLFLTVFVFMIDNVIGNGYMIDPPARSSMWRLGYKTPTNYDDMSINCGGAYRQWVQNKGVCGVCGDPIDGERRHEAGGIYATGVITRTYRQGGTIPIRVNLTSSHGGWFEFRICPNNDVTKAVTHECLEMHLLRMANEPDKSRFTDVPRGGQANPTSILMEYQLPADLLCSHCVLQWVYNTGKDWGCDDQGTCAIGLGNQEQFIGCSDIAITADGAPNTRTVSTPNTSSTKSAGSASTSRSISETPFGRTPSVPPRTTPTPRQPTAKPPSPSSVSRTASTVKSTVKPPPSVPVSRTASTIKPTVKPPPSVPVSRTASTIKSTVNPPPSAPISRTVSTTISTANPPPPDAISRTVSTMKSTMRPSSNVSITPFAPTSAPTEPPIARNECLALGVLRGSYDEFCRNMCFSKANCPAAFCNEKCHQRAIQLDRCSSGESCLLGR